EDPVDTRRARSHHVSVQPHEGQAPIPLQGMSVVELHDGPLLRLFQPVVPRNPCVVLVGLAIPLFPIVPLAGPQADPQQKGEDGDPRLAGPTVDEIHQLVPNVVGNPDAFQGSPSSFFSWTYSCISSASTSFFCWSFCSRAAILRSLTSSMALRRWPFCS